mgnify:CR=1 FL=1
MVPNQTAVFAIDNDYKKLIMVMMTPQKNININATETTMTDVALVKTISVWSNVGVIELMVVSVVFIYIFF